MMTHLQNYLKVTWPSLTLSAAFTAGGVALVKEAATKTKGIALTLLGAYMLMNHIARYILESTEQLESDSQNIKNESFKDRTIDLVVTSTLAIPLIVLVYLGLIE